VSGVIKGHGLERTGGMHKRFEGGYQIVIACLCCAGTGWWMMGGYQIVKTFSFLSCAQSFFVEITQGDARLSKLVCMRIRLLSSKVTIQTATKYS